MRFLNDRNELACKCGLRVPSAWFVAICLAVGGVRAAQSQEAANKEPPKIAFCMPLHMIAGTNNKVTIRGWRLQEATNVRLQLAVKDGQAAEAKISNRSNAPTIDKYDPKRIGDQQLEIQCELPKSLAKGDWRIVVVTPAGESEPHPVVIADGSPMLSEREPNDGFRQAQKVSSEELIVGAIHANQNVDVFAIDMASGERLACEVFAARYGSLLDPLLSVYDARGNLVVTADDGKDSRDPSVTFTATNAGRYFVTIQDANDRGSAAHAYLLKLGRH